MTGFQKFLDALASEGGNLLILCVFVVLFGVTLNKVHYSDQIDTAMLSVFSGFTGALLMTLTRKTSAPKPEGGEK